MHVSTLIIGQGLCGSWLSHYLEKAGHSFLVIDHAQPQTPSKIASGIINPVTGRRLVKTWLIDEVMPIAVDAYQQIENTLIHPCPIIDFFSAPDVEIAFKNRVAEQADYLKLLENTEDWRLHFNFPFGASVIEDCWLVNVAAFLAICRSKLSQQQHLLEENFREDELKVLPHGVVYGNIEADKIIYCNGNKAAESTYFNRLPFAPNKGEALIVSLPELSQNFIFKKGMSLVPWQPNQWWVGSSYQWTFEDDKPTAAFKQTAESWLQNFCKWPFTVVDHVAAVRPATVERRPFVGFHPVHNAVGIFNGMGTKGVSLAPYFAKQLVDNITEAKPIMAEADIARFARVLSRKPF
jgi:glycine/D-amino acid oxidase-like deaminating enzyme